MANKGRKLCPNKIYYRLPQLLPAGLLESTGVIWPLTDPCHPHCDEAHVESIQWCKDLSVLSEEAAIKFKRYATGINAAMAFRRVSLLHLRLSNDLLHLFWLMDDVFDKLNVDESRAWGAKIKQIMSIPSIIPDSLPPLERAIQEYDSTSRVISDSNADLYDSWWSQVNNDLKSASSALALFQHLFNDWLDSMVAEANDREKKRALSFEEYITVRGISVGLLPVLAWGVLMFEVKDAVLQVPTLQKIISESCELVSIANDIYSYNKEQAKGEGAVAHNIVNVIQKSKNKGIQDAMDHAGAIYKQKSIDVVKLYHSLPVLGDEADNTVLWEYALVAIDWIESNVEFSLSSFRYFGEQAGCPKLRTGGLVELREVEIAGTDSAQLM